MGIPTPIYFQVSFFSADNELDKVKELFEITSFRDDHRHIIKAVFLMSGKMAIISFYYSFKNFTPIQTERHG